MLFLYIVVLGFFFINYKRSCFKVKLSSENESVIKLKITFTPPDSQVLNLSIFILEQLQQHFDNLPLTVIIQFDGVLLQLSHQVIGSHEPEVLVSGRHLNQTKFKHFFTFMEFL